MSISNIEKRMEGIKNWQEQVLTIRTKLFRIRAERIEQAKKNLVAMTRAVQTKHEMIRNSINKEALYKEANIRVNRGLEALQRLTETLREINMTDDLLTRAINDPIMSASIKEVTRRALASDFVKSIQKQLVVQTEFINIAAHELRTPIMPILASVETLEAELGEKNEEVMMIKRNALRLLHLTENILSLTKIESNSLDLKKELFDLNSLLSDIVKQKSIRIENKNAKLLLNTKNEVYVNADRDDITRVVLNLLDNAIKFTHEGIISITTERIDDNVVVSISDSGPGIKPQLFPILFTKFVTMSYKGTGLGLYISKGIIQAHGGKIWAKNNNEYGKAGATFAFSLPLESNDALK